MQAASSAVSSANDGLGAFVSWAQQAGIKFECTAPATFGALRGVSATSGIQPGDDIMCLPRAAALTLGPKQKCPFPDFVAADYWASAPWFVKMGLKLLHERRLGQDSNLRLYIEHLPAAVDVPVLWSDDELQALQYPHLIQQVSFIDT